MDGFGQFAADFFRQGLSAADGAHLDVVGHQPRHFAAEVIMEQTP
jgi:hypothetical protein